MKPDSLESLFLVVVIFLIGMCFGILSFGAEKYPLDRDTCGGFGNIMADVAQARERGHVLSELVPDLENSVKLCTLGHGAENCVGGTPAELSYIEAKIPEAWQMAEKLEPYTVGKHFFDECMQANPGVNLPQGIKAAGPQIES